MANKESEALPGFAPSYSCDHSGQHWELKGFVPMRSQGALAEHRQIGEGRRDWDGAILHKVSGVESGAGVFRARSAEHLTENLHLHQ